MSRCATAPERAHWRYVLPGGPPSARSTAPANTRLRLPKPPPANLLATVTLCGYDIEMKYQPVETLVLLASVAKWTLIAVGVGAVVGALISLFLTVLNLGMRYTSSFSHYYMLLPFALMGCVLFIRHFCPDAQGHGTERVIESIHKEGGQIRPR